MAKSWQEIIQQQCVCWKIRAEIRRQSATASSLSFHFSPDDKSIANKVTFRLINELLSQRQTPTILFYR